MSTLATARIGATAAIAVLTFAGVAVAAGPDLITDKPGDNPAGTIDINHTFVDPTCNPTFTILTAPKKVKPISGGLPAIQVDSDGNGRPDRLVGQPKGREPGVYAISGTKIGRRLEPAKPVVDSSRGSYVTWQVTSFAVVKARRIRWRAVSRSAASGPMDRAPNRGFAATSFSTVCS